MKTHIYHFISFLMVPLLLITVLIPVAPAIAQPAGPLLDLAHVKVAHLAPFADTLDGTSVLVRVDTVSILGPFKFGDIFPTYMDVLAGDHLIEILPAAGGSALITQTINVTANTFYTISIIGNNKLQPMELFKQVDDTEAPLAGAKLRFTHLAPVAADINSTKVDICTNLNVVVPGLAGIAYKGFTDPYLPLLPGDYKLKITQAGSSCAVVLIDLPSIRLATGDIVDVFAIGDVIDQPLAAVSTTGITFTPFAHVKLGHFAPFAGTVDGTSVTVEVNGAPVLTDFKFGDVTPVYVDIPSGTDLLVKIYPSGNPAPIITQIINLTEDTFYTIAIIGNDSIAYPLELDPLVDDVTRPVSGAKVRVADFAALSFPPFFDICTSDNVVVPGLSGLGYKSVTAYLNLPAGVYNLKITVGGTGCAFKLYDVPTLILINYTVVTVFAIGDVTHLPASVVLRWEQPPILSFLPMISK